MIAETVSGDVELPDCGHAQWSLGCPRCFQDLVRMASIAAQTDDIAQRAHLEGAVNYNWYVLTVLSSMEQQILPKTNSIDLKLAGQARDLLANVQHLIDHFAATVSNPAKLAQVMVTSAKALEALRKRQESSAAAAPDSAPNSTGPDSKIVLTDRG